MPPKLFLLITITPNYRQTTCATETRLGENETSTIILLTAASYFKIEFITILWRGMLLQGRLRYKMGTVSFSSYPQIVTFVIIG